MRESVGWHTRCRYWGNSHVGVGPQSELLSGNPQKSGGHCPAWGMGWACDCQEKKSLPTMALSKAFFLNVVPIQEIT
jgi:hypothetical protein